MPAKDGHDAVPPLGDSVAELAPTCEAAIRQNTTMDIYEEYFSGDAVDHSSEPPSAKGLAVFRDPHSVKRTATSIDWHPEGPSKIAVSYSILSFQDPRFMNERMPVQSYIWDIMNPNTPDCELIPGPRAPRTPPLPCARACDACGRPPPPQPRRCAACASTPRTRTRSSAARTTAW